MLLNKVISLLLVFLNKVVSLLLMNLDKMISFMLMYLFDLIDLRLVTKVHFRKFCFLLKNFCLLLFSNLFIVL